MGLKSIFTLSVLIFSMSTAFSCYAQGDVVHREAVSNEMAGEATLTTEVKDKSVHGVSLSPSKEDIIAAASNTVATASNTISYLSTFFAIGTTVIVIVLTVAGIIMQFIGKRQRQHYLEEIAKVFDKNDEVKQIFVQHVIQDGEFKNLVKDAIKAAAREEAQKVLEVYEAKKAKDKVKEALGDVISD